VGRLRLAETDEDNLNFLSLTLREAIEAFTEAAYGKQLNFFRA